MELNDSAKKARARRKRARFIIVTVSILAVVAIDASSLFGVTFLAAVAGVATAASFAWNRANAVYLSAVAAPARPRESRNVRVLS